MGEGRSSEPPNADALEQLQPSLFHALRKGLFIDELYALTILRLAWWMAIAANWLDRWVWSGIPLAVSALTKEPWVGRFLARPLGGEQGLR